MRLGVISDTHDNLANISKAMQIFLRKNINYIIHCGDISSASTILYFKGVPVKFIKGNCDFAIETIKENCKVTGNEYLGDVAFLIENGKQIAIIHGDNETNLQEIILSQKYDYVLTGHTHIVSDETCGKTRIINPGSHKAGGRTIAIIEIEKNIVDFITLPL